MSVNSQSKRILFLSTTLAKGGAETQLVRLAISLKQRNWEVAVCSISPACHFAEELDSHAVPYFSLEASNSSLLAGINLGVRLSRLIQSWKPTIIITFMYHANILGRLVGSLHAIPVIASIRGEKFGGALRDMLEHITQSLSRVTVINSYSAARTIVERGVIHKDRVRVIQNSVETVTPPIPNEASTTVTEKGLRWVAVGRLEDQKDYPTLFLALRELLKTHPATTLKIAGSGSREKALKDLANDMGLDSCITFLGQRKDVTNILDSADALVLSSAWEGMPNVVMEALSRARPVVATDVGGVNELVEHGVSGFIVPPRDSIKLASAMRQMSMLPIGRRIDMGESGRKRMKSYFSPESIANQWETLIASITH